jgi:hypothetical protein
MSIRWVEHFPNANPNLLLNIESLFISKLTIHQQLEAIVLFASALEKKIPKDADFFIVSDDSSLKNNANHWIIMRQDDYWHPEFTPDFFFRVSTNLDPYTVDGKRDFDKNIYQSILDGRKCVVFTREKNTRKYLNTFPNSFVVQARI